MTHITIYKSSATNRTVGFKSAGHAGYAEEGSDIICSAISVLTINTINSIEQFTDAVYDMSVDEEEASIDYIVTSNISDTTQVLLDALELGLRTMAADNPEEEVSTLNKWVEDAYVAHEYYYRPKQEFYALYDPTALYWDLGDDPFKAADYQIKNLKISIANFMKWYAKEDYDISRRTELYASLIKLFTNRVMELSFWIGGLYLNEGKEEINLPVSKEIQQKALNYLVKMSMDLDWLTNAEIKSSLELQDLIVDKTRKYIFQLLFDRIRYVALCSEKSEGQYSVKKYMDDIHSIVWKGVLQNRILTNTEMIYQNAFIDYLIKNISKNMGGSTAKSIGYQQSLRGDSFKMGIFSESNSFVMGWQAQDIVPVNSHQDASVYWDMLLKIRTLLSSRISSVSSDMKEYYDFLIYKINQTLDDN